MSEARNRLNVALEALGIMAKRSLGQNFLVSDTVINKIIEQVKVEIFQLMESVLAAKNKSRATP